MKVRPAALIVQKGKALVMVYQYGSTKVCLLPGGNPDPGETMEQTLIRELKEELGIDIVIGNMILAGEVLRFKDKEDALHCLFTASFTNQEPIINPAETTAVAIEWVELAALKELNLYPNFGAYLDKLPSSFQYVGDLKQVYF